MKSLGKLAAYFLFGLHLVLAVTSVLLMDTNSGGAIALFFAEDVIDAYELIGGGMLFVGIAIVTVLLGGAVVVARWRAKDA